MFCKITVTVATAETIEVENLEEAMDCLAGIGSAFLAGTVIAGGFAKIKDVLDRVKVSGIRRDGFEGCVEIHLVAETAVSMPLLGEA